MATDGDPVISKPPAPASAAPYPAFVLSLLGFCLLVSVPIFVLFEPLPHKSITSPIFGISLLSALALGWNVRIAWRLILTSEPESVIGAKETHRSVLRTTVIIVLLSFGLAAFLGHIIGQNRKEAIQLNVDIEHQRELVRRISATREVESEDLPSYVSMYLGLEPQVAEYKSTLLRMRTELVIYDAKFPEQNSQTQKFKASVEREIRRSNLLDKQIAVAKRMAQLAETEQRVLWKTEMVPLLEEEDKLDLATE